MPQQNTSRRQFLRQSAVAAVAASAVSIVPRHVLGGAGQVAPSAKATLVGIGVGGQGMQNMAALQEYPEIQVVAVCDVNKESGGYLSWNWNEGKARNLGGREPARRAVEETYAKRTGAGAYKGCKTYVDYRELLEKEDADAVMIGAADHMHAVITMAALRRKKHVYCEKPLTYSVYECRQVAEAAKKAGVATQMGNHGQASEEARVTCELIWDGAIGPVHEVQVWCPARFWPPALYDAQPAETPPVPDGLDWDLWLGPAPQRPYHPAYHPWTWRNWWDFGTGLFGDLGAHKLSTVFKALKLGRPTTIEACCTRNNGQTYPMGVIARYEFPARGDLPPVTLTWHDGGLRAAARRPRTWPRSRRRALHRPRRQDDGPSPDPRIEDEGSPSPRENVAEIPGHYKEFVNACHGGPPAGSNFVDHAGVLTETCLLGNVALLAQKPIQWDGPNLKITNDEAANKLLHREYRQGWSLG